MMTSKEIEFIDYTGEWPALCMGMLTLKINGKVVTFGSGDCDYDYFWATGGRVTFDEDGLEIVTRGEWQLDKSRLPAELQDHGEELIQLFNEHVPQGCCGGCV